LHAYPDNDKYHLKSAAAFKCHTSIFILLLTYEMRYHVWGITSTSFVWYCNPFVVWSRLGGVHFCVFEQVMCLMWVELNAPKCSFLCPCYWYMKWGIMFQHPITIIHRCIKGYKMLFLKTLDIFGWNWNLLEFTLEAVRYNFSFLKCG
jgi:hypothetical protein